MILMSARHYGRLERLVNHYSEFIQHPIYLRKTEVIEVPDEDDEAEKNDEEVEEDDLDVSEDDEEDEAPQRMKEVTTHSWEKANADAALWNRPKADITDDDYQEFYKLISKDYANATSWSHFDAEGNINFKSLVYLPEELPANLKSGDYSSYQNSVKLYVRKVLISDEFELLPKYLSFVKGVVDSEDLPLNVNRETLQESKIIKIVAKKVTRKVLDLIKKFADESGKEEDDEVEIDEDGNVIEPEDAEDAGNKKPDPYLTWYEKFAPSLKMGVMDDDTNRQRLVKLLRVKTSKSNGEWKSFEEYVSGMKEYQNEIYYIPGTSLKEVEQSPFMDKFIEKGLEVVYFLDAVDEYMIERLREFDGKKFSIITKDDIKFGDADEDLQKRINAAYVDKFKPLTTFLNKFYGKSVSRTSVSKRLGSVPAIVSSGQYGNSANMERIIRAQVFAHGQDDNQVRSMRTLEINPRHPFIEKLLTEIPDDSDDNPDVPQELKDILWSLLDTALLDGGFTINNASAFSHRMTRMLKNLFDVDSLALLPEIEPKDEEDVPPEPMGDGGLNLDDFGDFSEDMDFHAAV